MECSHGHCVSLHSGMWEIEAWGASGAQGSMRGGGAFLQGGKGAKIRGSFPLKQGEVLKILVGQQGLEDYYSSHQPGGGGGGTFVVRDDEPLVIAGGGGGGGVPEPAGRFIIFVCINFLNIYQQPITTTTFYLFGLNN